MNKGLILFAVVFTFFSCINRDECEAEKIAEKEKCDKRVSISKLNIEFFGYFTEDADSIKVSIKRGDRIIETFYAKIPDEIQDSLRHLRRYDLSKKIRLTDTLLLSIKDEPIKKVYGFKYSVEPHYTNGGCGWGCDFSENFVDNEIMHGGVEFKKEGWHILEHKDFKDYYFRHVRSELKN